MTYIALFIIGLIFGWFGSFGYHYSQDGVEDTARGAWAIGILLIAVLAIIIILINTPGVNTSTVVPTVTPSLGR